MDAVVIIQNSRHKLRLWSAEAPEGVGQRGAEGQRQPLEHEVEFPAEASVYPEVEDAVEETIGGWQPHHHKLDPLWHAATRDCCGAENTRTEASIYSVTTTSNTRQQLLNEKSKGHKWNQLILVEAGLWSRM